MKKKLRLARIPLLLALVVVQFSIPMATVQAAPLPGTRTFFIQLFQDGAVRTSYPWNNQPQSHCDQFKGSTVTNPITIHYDADKGSTVTFSIYPKSNNNCTVRFLVGGLLVIPTKTTIAGGKNGQIYNAWT